MRNIEWLSDHNISERWPDDGQNDRKMSPLK